MQYSIDSMFVSKRSYTTLVVDIRTLGLVNFGPAPDPQRVKTPDEAALLHDGEMYVPSYYNNSPDYSSNEIYRKGALSTWNYNAYPSDYEPHLMKVRVELNQVDRGEGHHYDELAAVKFLRRRDLIGMSKVKALITFIESDYILNCMPRFFTAEYFSPLSVPATICSSFDSLFKQIVCFDGDCSLIDISPTEEELCNVLLLAPDVMEEPPFIPSEFLSSEVSNLGRDDPFYIHTDEQEAELEEHFDRLDVDGYAPNLVYEEEIAPSTNWITDVSFPVSVPFAKSIVLFSNDSPKYETDVSQLMLKFSIPHVCVQDTAPIRVVVYQSNVDPVSIENFPGRLTEISLAGDVLAFVRQIEPVHVLYDGIWTLCPYLSPNGCQSSKTVIVDLTKRRRFPYGHLGSLNVLLGSCANREEVNLSFEVHALVYPWCPYRIPNLTPFFVRTHPYQFGPTLVLNTNIATSMLTMPVSSDALILNYWMRGVDSGTILPVYLTNLQFSWEFLRELTTLRRPRLEGVPPHELLKMKSAKRLLHYGVDRTVLGPLAARIGLVVPFTLGNGMSPFVVIFISSEHKDPVNLNYVFLYHKVGESFS